MKAKEQVALKKNKKQNNLTEEQEKSIQKLNEILGISEGYEFMDGYVTIGTELDTTPFDSQIAYVKSQLDDIEDKLRQADMGFEVGDVFKLEAEYEKLTTRLKKLTQQKEQFNKTDFSGIKGSIDNVGKSVDKVTKKVVRWGLAVFGIRSMYLGLRQAMSTLTSQDEQLKADIDYMKNAIAYALEPVIRGIVNLMKQLMFYVGYIIKAWTGKNIFANANKSLQNATGSAKKLNKELDKTTASFDEMNVLQDTSSSGAEDTGAAAPSFNLEDMDIEVPEWIQWIADNGETIIAILAGIVGGVIALKLGLTGIMALGIGAIIAGILLLIKDIIKFIDDPSWEGFVNILGDIAIIIGGIMLLMGNWWGLLVIIIGAAVKLIADNWDAIMEILGGVGEWFYNTIIKPVGDFFTGLWDNIKKGAAMAWDGIKNIFGTVAKFFGDVFGSAWEAVKRVFSTGGKIFMGIVDGILNGFKKIVNTIITGINKVVAIPFKGINSILKALKKINILGVKPFGWIGTISVPQLPKLAKGGIINMPGKGIPVGGAIGGEAGREGVIPLTDSQQMALLGEAIGKYITINASITNTMNGRVISRELQKINNESSFAFNR